jgi:transcriptional regulator with XRE-family HTH domain
MFRQLRQPALGRRLQQLRAQGGLTRAQLCEATGVGMSALVRLERGHDVRLSTYLPISGYFIDHAPQVWLAAERFVLLSRARREGLVATIERFEAKGGSHD